MSQNGTRVFIVADKNTADDSFAKSMIDYGFEGYLVNEDGMVTGFKDFYSDADGRKVSEIKDFNSREALLSKINSADPDSVKIVNVGNYLSLITTGERDITDRIDNLVGLFGDKVFKFFMLNTEMTAEHAVNTALGYKMSNIVDLKAGDFAEITEILESAVSAENIGRLEEKLKVSNNAALRIFLTRIEENTKDKEQIPQIKFAFLKTIAQKAKVKADIYSESDIGLKDKNLERYMTLSALSAYDADTAFMSDFAGSIGSMNTAQVHALAAAEVLELIGDKTRAATAYEFLLAYAEREKIIRIDERTTQPLDSRHVAELLKAA
jgi:hypothetical protein